LGNRGEEEQRTEIPRTLHGTLSARVKIIHVKVEVRGSGLPKNQKGPKRKQDT